MFKVVVNDGSQELPNDDIYYIVAKEGVFLKKKLGVMESIAPVKNISILNSVNTMARMYINPIPAQWGAKIADFFKAVCQEYHGEAIVLLFYNESTGKYKIVPPTQKVTAGACDYNRGITMDGYTMIGDIHSHARMSAFHSGTDDNDEKTFDGLHITFGHVLDDEISISASIVANGHRFIVTPEDYMLGLDKTRDIDKSETKYMTKIFKPDATGKMVLDEKASSRTSYKNRVLDKRYQFKVSKAKGTFNKNWMKMVQRGIYTYSYRGYGIGNYAKQDWRRNVGVYGWGGHYDPQAWDQVDRPIGKNGQRIAIPGFAGQKPLPPTTSSTTPATTSPTEKPYDKSNPCLSCKHRNLKIMNEIQGVEYEEEMYQCEKCHVIFTTVDADIKCPKCKSDGHLTLIDEKDLTDRYKNEPVMTKDLVVKNDEFEQPEQRGFITCPSCSNQVLVLETDQCCPFCQTLLPDDVLDCEDELEWVCPHCQATFGESEIEVEGECPHCNNKIELTYSSEDEETMICNHCGAKNSIESIKMLGICENCNSPITVETIGIEHQMRSDSGAFLDQSDKEHEDILNAAADADKNLERIPDPKRSDQLSSLKSKSSLMDKMRKVFGGGNNDTTH